MNTRHTLVSTFVFALMSLGLTAPGAAQEASESGDTALLQQIVMPGDAVDLDSLIWQNRVLVVFADSPNDPRFIQQMEFLTERLEELEERDVIVLTDTSKSEGSALRTKLRPRGFMLAMIGKDGDVYLRKPLPWDVREISRVIDKMPMRQQEMRDRRGDS
ncbi:MAG: DUF4174 domain-containing protein [Pseudomonadota bacterium]